MCLCNLKFRCCCKTTACIGTCNCIINSIRRNTIRKLTTITQNTNRFSIKKCMIWCKSKCIIVCNAIDTCSTSIYIEFLLRTWLRTRHYNSWGILSNSSCIRDQYLDCIILFSTYSISLNNIFRVNIWVRLIIQIKMSCWTNSNYW